MAVCSPNMLYHSAGSSSPSSRGKPVEGSLWRSSQQTTSSTSVKSTTSTPKFPRIPIRTLSNVVDGSLENIHSEPHTPIKQCIALLDVSEIVEPPAIGGSGGRGVSVGGGGSGGGSPSSCNVTKYAVPNLPSMSDIPQFDSSGESSPESKGRRRYKGKQPMEEEEIEEGEEEVVVEEGRSGSSSITKHTNTSTEESWAVIEMQQWNTCVEYYGPHQFEGHVLMAPHIQYHPIHSILGKVQHDDVVRNVAPTAAVKVVYLPFYEFRVKMELTSSKKATKWGCCDGLFRRNRQRNQAVAARRVAFGDDNNSQRRLHRAVKFPVTTDGHLIAMATQLSPRFVNLDIDKLYNLLLDDLDVEHQSPGSKVRDMTQCVRFPHKANVKVAACARGPDLCYKTHAAETELELQKQIESAYGPKAVQGRHVTRTMSRLGCRCILAPVVGITLSPHGKEHGHVFWAYGGNGEQINTTLDVFTE